ncbi:MAG: bacterioferritin-associated ferredoxin [Sphingomonadales bacterium]
MIVCVCNALNEKKIRSAVAGGATTPARVHAANGTKVCCGMCVPDIHNIISAEKPNTHAAR